MSTALALAVAIILPCQSVEVSAREAALAEKLSHAVMAGWFTLDGQPMDQPLHQDRYELGKVEKVRADGLWRFEARVQYGDRDVRVPVPLFVRWSDDETPVLTLDRLPIPGLGTFTARVMFHGERYAGTWSGEGHGGHMFGYVERPPAEAEVEAEPAHRWPQFRGPDASGVDDSHALVDRFDIETGENVRWRTEIPGLAHSSPVIWGDRLIVTSAVRLEGDASLQVGLYGDVAPVPDEGMHDFRVYCLDRTDGSISWERTATTAVPKVKRHTKGSHAASSPATDGKRIVAFFASEGLYCYDMDGTLQWSRDLGLMDSGWYWAPKDAEWGYSASPVLHDDKVIMQCDLLEDSFLVVLDATTGEDVWRAARDELPTWSTPTVDTRDGRAQIICNGYKHIGGYDLATGEELWKLAGGGDIPVPTPVVWEDLVFIASAHGPMAPTYAIKAMASGTLELDESDPNFQWLQRNRGNYMQTPLVYRGHLYCCRDNGALRCLDPRTGERVYAERLGGGTTGFTASGVAGDGKLFFTAESGEVFVVHAGEMFGLHDVSDLNEECMATPAITGGVIYFRGRRHVTAIGATDE